MSRERARAGDGNARPPTLYADFRGVPAPDERCGLSSEETRHVRSLRLRTGEPVELTDGAGGRWSGRLERLDGREATVRIERELAPVEPPPFHLVAPVGSRDRALWLVEKAVEIGVAGLTFVEFARSRSVADGGRSDGFLERARRRAIAALKQSGGSRLPGIEGPVSLADALAAPNRGTRWLAAFGGRPVYDVAGETALAEGLVLAVGPEGGLEPEEEGVCAEAGFVPVSLGPRVLRFETAALAGLAIAVSALDSRRETRASSGEPGPGGRDRPENVEGP